MARQPACKARLTKAFIDGIEPADTDQIIWDTTMPGMFLKVTPKGKRSFGIFYRNASGTQRRPKLGNYGQLTVETARKAAGAWFAKVAAGKDPSGDRRASRAAPDLDAVFKRFIEEYAKEHKKPRSIEEDERNYRKHVGPVLGAKKIAEINRSDISKLHGKLGGPRGNRVVALLSKLFNLCEEWELRPLNSNPCRHLKRYKEQSRNRYLTPAELGRLGAALARAEQLQTEPIEAITAIRLLLFTGARKSEVLTLRWRHVDLDAGELRLDDSKTGRKTIHLPAPAREVLAALASGDADAWVFPGAKVGQRLINLQKPWRRIAEEAELPGVRIHDLRHAFAAIGASGGASLYVIGGLLGHAQATTTQQYAHLQSDPLKATAEKIGAEIDASLKGGKANNVTALNRRG